MLHQTLLTGPCTATVDGFTLLLPEEPFCACRWVILSRQALEVIASIAIGHKFHPREFHQMFEHVRHPHPDGCKRKCSFVTVQEIVLRVATKLSMLSGP